MKKLMLAFSILSMALTSCHLLFQKPIPQKSHPMAYYSKGYCDNPTLTNKSEVELRISRRAGYHNGEMYIYEDSMHFTLEPNKILDTDGIRLQEGTIIAYSISWNDWKQGDVIKYELKCDDTLEPLKVNISYDNYKREQLFVYESKEAKATGLDYEWEYWH